MTHEGLAWTVTLLTSDPTSPQPAYKRRRAVALSSLTPRLQHSSTLSSKDSTAMSAAPNYPERPYDAHATAQAPPTMPSTAPSNIHGTNSNTVPGTNMSTGDAKGRVQDQAALAREKAALAQEKARQLGNQVRSIPYFHFHSALIFDTS